VCADAYLLASVPALAHLRQKRREWAFNAGVAIWFACALWTGLSSASWLEHALETAQAPVEQRKEIQAKTESERQADLAKERVLLDKQEDASLNGKGKEIRDNATKLAAETRARIAQLEKQNTFPAKTENAPIKSPFSGYETLVTFLLLAFSQGCWFMALDEETAEASGAEIGKREAEISARNDTLLPGNKGRKQAGNVKRRPSGAPGNAEGAQIIEFRKRPTREEILAFLDGLDGTGKMVRAAAHFRYSGRQLRNILNEKSRSQAAA
jgi:hypothetical protein